MTPPPNNPHPTRLTRLQMFEATGAAVLASAIVSTAGGMFWLVVTLPQKLTLMEASVQQLGRTLTTVDQRVERLEEKQLEHDGRLTRIEVHRR